METVLTFHNTHEAINGEQILLEGGVMVKVMALPSSLGAGCGLCLRVALAEFECSRRLLGEAKIRPQAVYHKKIENGKICYIQTE